MYSKMKIKKLILTLIPTLLLSCNSVVSSINSSSSMSQSQINDSSSEMQSSSEELSSSLSESSSSEDSTNESSSSEISSVIDLTGYNKLFDGLYVNYLPGIYDDSITLKFKITDPNKTLYYSVNHDLTNKNKLDKYTNPLRLCKKSASTLQDYPLTTSVDAILADDTGGKCVSNNYIYNVQIPKKYTLTTRQNVISISLIDNTTNESVLNRSLTYIIDDNASEFYTIPVVSISMPYDDYFGSQKGFYNKIREDISKRANIEYFDSKYDEYFYRNTQIKLGGNWTLGYPQRTLNLNLNKDENGNKNKPLTEHIFKERTALGNKNQRLTSLKRIRLHNGGNCFEEHTGFNDAVIQNMMYGSNVSTTGYRPCITFLNGEYWGIYYIREHYKDVYFEANYGVEKDDVILYELQGGFIFDDGDEENAQSNLNDLLNYLKEDFSNDDVYQQFIDDYIDIDSFIDLFIAESYACNWDFVGNNNNLKMWKTSKIDDSNPYADGKWRFCLHDADFAFTENTNFLRKDVDHSYANFEMFKCLLKNQNFRDRFYQRAVELIQTNLSANNGKNILNSMVEEVEPFKVLSAKRWGQNDNFYSVWKNNIRNTLNYFDNRSSNYLNELKNTLNSYK